VTSALPVGMRFSMVTSRYGKFLLLPISVILLGMARAAVAQPVHPPPTAAAATESTIPGSELTIYLMTMGPGDEVWEKFGHNAIWIHDSLRNTDVAYNWGLFDFAEADFFPRFLRGDMRYWMGGFDQQATLDFYRRANRQVWAQELNLTPDERVSLARFIEWNARPENRFYHYDYFRDNCSTRVRDALDNALGGVIKRATDHVPSGTTYRSHTRRLTQDELWVYFGTLLGLGHPVDREISRWEEMFLPVKFHDNLRGIHIRDASGASVPLVKNEMILFTSSRAPERLEPATHIPAYLIVGILVLVVCAMLRYVADGGSNAARIALLIVAGAWNLFAGVAGTALAALWLFTNHVYSYYNENLLQSNPLSLVLAIMILASMSRREAGISAGVVGDRTRALATIVASLAVLGFMIQILPMFNQVNGEVIALMMPAHIGVALSLGRWTPWSSRSPALSSVATAS
jgi:Domain of unknown function (DUF4105)